MRNASRIRSLEVIIFATEEIIGGADISSPVLPGSEVGMLLVVGHRAEVVIFRRWQVMMEVTGKVHRESNKAAGLVHLVVLIIIVGLLFGRLIVRADFRG